MRWRRRLDISFLPQKYAKYSKKKNIGTYVDTNKPSCGKFEVIAFFCMSQD